MHQKFSTPPRGPSVRRASLFTCILQWLPQEAYTSAVLTRIDLHFMGSSVYKRILELRRVQAVMTIYDDDIDFGKLRMYSRSSYFGREVAEVANIPYNETRTKKKNIYLFFQRACKICCFKMRPYNTATHPSVKAISAYDALMQLPEWLRALLKYFGGKK